MFQQTDAWSLARLMLVKNGSGEVVPAYGAMRITGVTNDVYDIAKPNSNSIEPAMLLINGPGEIPIGAEGHGTQATPVRAACTGTPAADESWGTATGTWTLATGQTGFRAWGGVVAGSAIFARVSGASSPCTDPGSPPEGWTDAGPQCYVDLIQKRCNASVNEYRLIRLFLSDGQFVTWTGPWGTTNPPTPP